MVGGFEFTAGVDDAGLGDAEDGGVACVAGLRAEVSGDLAACVDLAEPGSGEGGGLRGIWLPQSTSSASIMFDRTGGRGISGP